MLFIRKAVQYRLPASAPLNRRVRLKPVDPFKGWLADRWRPDSLPMAKAAPYKDYKGDTTQAFWYFDKEMADATEKYYAAVRGKKEQYIGYRQNNTLLPFQPKIHARINPKFEPLQDGVTFHVAAAYTDSGRTKMTDQHAAGKIIISRICGPVVKLNDSTFSVRFYRMGFNSPKRTGDIWLIAENDGDGIYKSAVQQANIRIPQFNKEGKLQQIIFPPVTDQMIPFQPVSLKAKATSGLPVYYYVMEGPAEINNKNEVVFTKIPPRSKYPVKVTVVAWQYGRAIEPKIQTAEPVFQTFYLNK